MGNLRNQKIKGFSKGYPAYQDLPRTQELNPGLLGGRPVPAFNQSVCMLPPTHIFSSPPMFNVFIYFIFFTIICWKHRWIMRKNSEGYSKQNWSFWFNCCIHHLYLCKSLCSTLFYQRQTGHTIHFINASLHQIDFLPSPSSWKLLQILSEAPETNCLLTIYS